MGSNGVLVSGNGLSSMSSDHAAKRKWCGSVDFLKQQMSDFSYSDNHVWKQQPAFSKLSGDFSDDNQQHQNMLSFSSPKNNGELDDKNLLQNSSFPFFQHPSSFCSKNAGYSCNNGSMNATSMYFMNGVKGAFTATQWCELEQQALIFKYIIANEPIPPNLLIPIRSAFESAPEFSGFPAGLLRPNLFGWGPFHLGLANSTDPEAGRCRRTDGKKWRCSRDAVPDQKYCERHINRGRHRSRKPVEGQTGHSLCGATTNKSSNSNTATVMNMASSSAALDLVGPGGGPSNSFAINLNQSKDLHSLPVHRPMVNKANSSDRMQNTFSITESDSGYFPFLTSDGTTLNTTQGGSSVSRTCTQSQHSPQFFMDDPSNILLSKLETQANRTTKLSVSIPPADFMSSTSSPTGERIALSPLRLSRELDPAAQVHIGSGMGLGLDPKETSLGGPLGEVLKTTMSNSSGDQSKSIPALNLLSNGSESSSQLGLSPTGVLGYFSNSSGGSSPRTEYGRALESGSLIGFNLGMRH